MKIADAHCDTLTKFPDNPFFTSDAHWNIDKFKSVNGALQYFAIFTPPEFAGDSALRYAVSAIGNFYRSNKDIVSLIEASSDWKDGTVNIILSLEGASPVINDLNNLHAFYKLGVRAMGLTWNHRNFAADGVDNDYGLTAFGRELVEEMEKLNMIIDVSHLNVTGFDDVVKHTSKPFIASHSNAAAVCNHKRNLADDQIREIVRRGGFIGINFYSGFIGEYNSDLKNGLLRHIAHFLDLGAENVLGMGADFDGIDMCPFDDATGYNELIAMLRADLKLSEKTISKIMGENLINFTLENI